MQFNALAGTHNLSADKTMLKYVFALYHNMHLSSLLKTLNSHVKIASL